MDQTVFITGATSGIGKACAEIFARNGYHLIINGRRKEKLDEIKSSLENKFNISIFCIPFDVGNRKEVFESIENLPSECQEINILINSAGLALGRELFDDADLSDWETMLDTNVSGLLYVTKAVLPFMIKQNKGHIINLGSIAGDQAYERGNIYCATKAAVDTISKAMRIDLLPHRIKVTNIKPGAVETEFAVVRFKGDEEKAGKTYEGFTPLTPKDIAESIFYCASLPENVCINELSITCLAQANGIYTLKE